MRPRCVGDSTTGFPSLFPVPLPLALLPFFRWSASALLQRRLGFPACPTPRLSHSLRLLCLLCLLFLWLFPRPSLYRSFPFPLLRPYRPAPPASRCAQTCTNRLAVVAFGDGPLLGAIPEGLLAPPSGASSGSAGPFPTSSGSAASAASAPPTGAGPGATGSSPPAKSGVSVVSLESLSRTSLATSRYHAKLFTHKPERYGAPVHLSQSIGYAGMHWAHLAVHHGDVIYFCTYRIFNKSRNSIH